MFVTDVEIRDLTVRDVDTWMGAILAGQDTRIYDSLFIDNEVAVEVWDDWSNGVVVRGSRFQGNAVGVRSDASRNEITDNRFIENDTAVHLHEIEGTPWGSIVDGNLFHRNMHGLDLRDRTFAAPSEAIRVTRNRFVDNLHGGATLRFDALAGASARVEDNLFHGNGLAVGGDGLDVAASLNGDGGTPSLQDVVVAGNRAIDNGGHGLHAPGVTDGGGNIGRLNGAADCVGVVCRPPGRS